MRSRQYITFPINTKIVKTSAKQRTYWPNYALIKSFPIIKVSQNNLNIFATDFRNCIY